MFKGYVINEEGKRLEKKNNWCNRQCKYKFKGKDLPQTIPVRCKCEGTDCSYQFKMKGVFKKWRTWGDKDDQGNFFVDQNGVPSKQLECGVVDGVWAEWSDFSCQGSCPGNQLMKRTRKCLDSKEKSVELSSDQCIGESEEVGEKCLKIDFDEPSVEPITKTEYDEDSSLFQSLEKNPCVAEMLHAVPNKDYFVSDSSTNHEMYFNRQEFCHFPSFGKGWFDEVMENGDHVQMGVQCENDWNMADHSFATKGQTCQLVCKNLSGNKNVYTPVAKDWARRIGSGWIPVDLRFQCQSPIPIFAFQKEKCNKNLIPNEDGTHEKYDDCYDDWVTKGLNMGSQSPHEAHRIA